MDFGKRVLAIMDLLRLNDRRRSQNQARQEWRDENISEYYWKFILFVRNYDQTVYDITWPI